MDIIEQTRILGQAIQESNEFIHYNAVRQINDEDNELQEMIKNFNLMRMNLNSEASKDDKDEKKLKEMNKEIHESYNNIMNNENMVLFNNAKEALDKIVEKINGIITLCLEGQDPATCEPSSSSCGGGCSSCSGCH